MVRLIDGTPGPDTLVGDSDILDEIRGGGGDDRLISPGPSTGAVDVLFGEEGNDTILASGFSVTAAGGPGDDSISAATTSLNTIIGGDGNDTLLGGTGPDYLAGDEDELFASTGPATGNDVLVSGADGDVLFGGPGDDLIEPGAPGATVADIVAGGPGIDTLVLPGRPDQYDIFFDSALRVYRAIGVVGAVALTDTEFSDIEQVAFGIGAVALKAGDVPLALATLDKLLPVGGNRPTIALSDTVEAAAGTTVIPISVADLLANDFDAEGDALVLGSFDTGSAPATYQVLPDAAGIAAAGYDPARYAGGLILVTLATPFTPTLTFRYTPFDPVHGLEGSTGIVTVVAAPQTGAADDLLRGTIGGGEIIPLSVLLANDAPDLTVTGLVGGFQIAPGVTQVNRSNGSFILDLPAQVVRFTHANSGPDLISFQYQAADALGGLSTATVQIRVDNRAPEVFDRVITVQPGVTTTVLLDDLVRGGGNTDPDGDPLILAGYQLLAPGNLGSIAYFADRIEFTPAAGYAGGYAFDYFIQDAPDLLGAQRDTPRVGALLSFAVAGSPPVAGDDQLTLLHDRLLVIPVADLLVNDSDPDGGTLSITGLFTGTLAGTAVLLGNSIFFTPAAGFVGTDSFAYEVTDGTRTAVGTVRIAITNTAPVALDDAFVTRPGLGRILSLADLTGNDIDGDGDALTITALSTPVNGSVLLNGDSVVYAPAPGFIGRDSFTYTISDGIASSTATVVFDMVNSPPVAGIDGPVDVRPRVPLSVDVAGLLLNDSDPDGDALRISGVVFAQQGQVTFDGVQFVYRAPADYAGPDSFGYFLTDGYVDVVGTFLVNVVNSAPVAGTDGPFDIRPGVPLNIDPSALLANDSDADNDFLTIIGGLGARNGAVIFRPDNLVYRSSPGYAGPDSFGYLLTDGFVTVQGAVEVNVVNATPVAGTDGPFDIRPGVPLNIDPSALLANDSDADGDFLEIIGGLGALNGDVTFRPDNLVYKSRPGYVGPDSFGYFLTDGYVTVQGAIEVNVVNAAPVAGTDGPFDVRPGVLRPGVPLNIDTSILLANDSDADGDSLSVIAGLAAQHGSVTFNGQNLVYQSNPGYVGPDSFGYLVTDGFETVQGSILVNVVNNPPVAVTDGPYQIRPGVRLSIDQSLLLQNDGDADGDGFEVVGTLRAENGTISYDGRVFTYTSNPGFVGRDSFGYRISDGFVISDGTVLVDVVNRAPVAGTDGPFDIRPGVPLSIDTGVLLANDSDADRDPLRIFGVVFAENGTVDFDGTEFVYRSKPGYSGPDSFGYLVTDGTVEVEGRVLLNVVNSAPVAGTDGPFAALPDQPLGIDVATLLANDSDAEGDAISVVAAVGARNGAVTFAGSQLIYQPRPGYAGPDSFGYRLTDGYVTVEGTILVKVGNALPVAAADGPFQARSGQPLRLEAGQLLANDSDADGDALRIADITPPGGGTVSMQPDGSLLYRAAAGFTGADSFTYRVTDGTAVSGFATVAILVEAANAPPVPVADAFTAQPGRALVIPVLTGLLGNDSDPDGDALSVTAVGNAVGGTVALTGGNAVFTPARGFVGTGGFSYTVADGAGGVATGIAQVAVLQSAPAGGGGTVFTGPGDDRVDLGFLTERVQANGGTGDDSIIAGSGDDVLAGGPGDDALDGGGGGDLLNGGTGSDTMRGGPGDDSYVVDDPGDQVVEQPGEGIDQVSTRIDWALAPEVETLILLGTEGLRGQGNALDNRLRGNAGDNLLEGLAGNDALTGGAGLDTLAGGAGRDTLTGGADRDLFRFDAPSDGPDRISDFTPGQDQIGLSAAGFGLGPGGLLLGQGQAAGSDPQLVYQRTSGTLLWDQDGQGPEAGVVLAVLAGRPALTLADLVLL
ncbi:Ig-like domain-containing protein [Paracraurococcus ruber]|uniref:Cadherin-like domain-containing protein n=1 Tax=Paracraurococcus ruber TaxID=77675 RepID=A0ABS1CVV4_9PROT|nr:Ig-like domain-containing protein [Paracraurococcus ruber]MBK1658540.1 hypothetical protein [Paracraurococcus ruber]TDG33175.1 calcium-binding protein [Paracraurococcus ruber]